MNKLQQIRVRTLNIKIELIKDLQLDCPIERNVRRKIARKNKMKWEVYKLLRNEIQFRLKNNLNLETGEVINEINN